MAKSKNVLEKAKEAMRKKIDQRKQKAAERIRNGRTPTKQSPRKSKRSKTPKRKSRTSVSPKTKKSWNFLDHASDMSLDITMTPSIEENAVGWHTSGVGSEIIDRKEHNIQYTADAVLQTKSKKRQEWFEENAEDLTIRIVAKPTEFKNEGHCGWVCKTKFKTEVDGTDVGVKLTFRAVLLDRDEVGDSLQNGWGSATPVKKDGWGMKSSPVSTKKRKKASPMKMKGAKTSVHSSAPSTTMIVLLVAMVLLSVILLSNDPMDTIKYLIEAPFWFILNIFRWIGLWARRFFIATLPQGLSNALPSA